MWLSKIIWIEEELEGEIWKKEEKKKKRTLSKAMHASPGRNRNFAVNICIIDVKKATTGFHFIMMDE